MCATLAKADLRIQVIDGDGLIQLPGTTSYRGLTIRVTETDGKAVPNARVTFRLPESEPTGTFPNGTKVEELLTDTTGTASVWGIKWSTTPGWCNVAITVRSGTATAGTVVRVRLAAAESAPSFEVTIRAPMPKQELEPAHPNPQSESITIAPVLPKRPGVMLTQTTDRVDRLPNPWVKRTLIFLGIAGGVGGVAAYKIMQPGAPTPPTLGVVPTPLTLSAPNITIGKP